MIKLKFQGSDQYHFVFEPEPSTHYKLENQIQMRFHDFQIVLQEVPGEVSLCWSITGCSIQCEGCHSPFLWKKGSGTELTPYLYLEVLEKYKELASCVLFMGGEWHEKELVVRLREAKEFGLKTCLYTGEDSVSEDISKQLDLLKTGKWDAAKGGLESEGTNQILRDVRTGENLNYLFREHKKKENDTINR